MCAQFKGTDEVRDTMSYWGRLHKEGDFWVKPPTMLKTEKGACYGLKVPSISDIDVMT